MWSIILLNMDSSPGGYVVPGCVQHYQTSVTWGVALVSVPWFVVIADTDSIMHEWGYIALNTFSSGLSALMMSCGSTSVTSSSLLDHTATLRHSDPRSESSLLPKSLVRAHDKLSTSCRLRNRTCEIITLIEQNWGGLCWGGGGGGCSWMCQHPVKTHHITTYRISDGVCFLTVFFLGSVSLIFLFHKQRIVRLPTTVYASHLEQ